MGSVPTGFIEATLRNLVFVKKSKKILDIYYKSQIGKISKILSFGLKDRTTNVVNMMRFMMKAKGPMDLLEENAQTKQISKRYNEINPKYQKLITKARECLGEKMIYFQYGGDLSLTSNLAGQLIHEFPNKIIIVVHTKGDSVNVSLRGRLVDIKKLTLKAIKDLKSARGGGHKHATGAIMSVDDLKIFKKRMEEMIDSIK